MPELLPQSPDYQQVCHLLDNADDSYWLPVIEHICHKHELKSKNASRIRQGGNLLYELDDKTIIKIVPPNWRYQGESEVTASRLLSAKLSLPLPEVFYHGDINGWIYLVMERLPGISLAEVWDTLNFENKGAIIARIGQLMKELHQLSVDTRHSPYDFTRMAPDWAIYYQQLKDDCIPRHKRKKVASELVNQIEAYFQATQTDCYAVLDDLPEDASPIFIHMDFHPWNLMVKETNGEYQLSGILDFGDAIIGRSRLLELATPLLFMCQGNSRLCQVLLDAYQLLDKLPAKKLKERLMAVSLLRPACDFNFVLAQVPQSGPRDSWHAIADQLFPMTSDSGD